jgi:hypothetical protein
MNNITQSPERRNKMKMKTSARFQLPARPFLLILFCVHAALYVVQLGDYCHRGKNREQIADSLGSQISTTPTSPLPPPVCSFSFLAVVMFFFSRLYIAEVTPTLKGNIYNSGRRDGPVPLYTVRHSLLICCCVVIHGEKIQSQQRYCDSGG